MTRVYDLPPPLKRTFVDARGHRTSCLLDFASGARFDCDAVADLLAWGHPLGQRSLLSGVEWALPGSWELSEPSPHPSALGRDARADALWRLLCDAVSRYGVGRVGVALSGGLDSRAIAAAAVETLPRVGCATFGDLDAPDLPVARVVARRLGSSQLVSELPLEAALFEESRVFEATGGLGGPASAPGAFTDSLWVKDFDVLLSGMSGDVIWGDTALRGPTPSSRLRKLGARAAESPLAMVPSPPGWATPAGIVAWQNLWTRQARVTWNGLLSRRLVMPVHPVLWDPPLVSFCLALDGNDRGGRSLLRHMLTRHAESVSPAVVPAVSGPVHDLNRAMRQSPLWRTELDAMLGARARWDAAGLRPRGVERLLRLVRDGKRPRAGLVSRLRTIWSWSWRLDPGVGRSNAGLI